MSGRQPTVLTVDDEPETCEMIDRAVQDAGFQAISMTSAERLRSRIQEADVLLLDINLPDANGIDLARELRASNPGLGIIMVTAQTEDVDRIIGLEVGADDYVCKPFNVRELVARIRSVLRRLQDREVDTGRSFRFNDIEVDLETSVVRRNGEPLNLTGHEFRLLVILAERPGRVFSREELSRQVSDREWNPSDRSIDVLVSKLRKKIDGDNGPSIRSLRGVGYQFAAHIEF